MSTSRLATETSAEASLVDGLAKLVTLPEWLLAALQADRVRDELQRIVPEFAQGTLTLSSIKIRRMLLKEDSGVWAGTYHLAFEDPGGAKRTLALRGTLAPHDIGTAEALTSKAAFGAAGWSATIPSLGLTLEVEPPEGALPAMPSLTEPAAARALLEEGIRACSYPDMRIEACQPHVISYKPGSRCTILYRLAYPPALAGRQWPTTVIAKTYRKASKGRNAYDGMLALWQSALAGNPAVTLAEPLAYLPAPKVMVQAAIGGDQSLEDALKAALKADTTAAYDDLNRAMQKCAIGLAAFHQSGVRHGELEQLEQRYAELHDRSARLYAMVPALQGAADRLLERLEALAAQTPADAPVPTHGTFNPEQVLIDGDRIGFIDFDEFCMAEPALDVGLFRAAIKDIGMNALDARQSQDRALRQARLERLDAICDLFLDEYERHAPISRQRVALWEAWSYLRDALHFWIKVKPAEPDNAMMVLKQHLRKNVQTFEHLNSMA